MVIYHGSKRIVKEPKPKGSHPANDYGPAFYLTTDLDAAKSWACRHDDAGIVNKYLIDDRVFAGFKVLDLTDKSKFSVLNWLAILMHFRQLDGTFVKANQVVLNWLAKYYIDVNEYDVIIGFRADDSYFRFPIRFISNDLAFEDLEEVFLSGNLGVQYAFVSERAIKALKFEKAIDCEEFFVGHYYSLVKEASGVFNVLINKPRDPRKTYILDLMRQ